MRAARAPQPVLEVWREQLRRLSEFALPGGARREVGAGEVTGDRVRLDSGGALRGRRLASLLRRAAAVQLCPVLQGAAVGAEIRRLTADGCMIEPLALAAAASAATGAPAELLGAQACAETGSRS